jgi:phosphatidylserine/phosphatidylglycerophosphate/cardiolipin synthase-like enzyme
VSIFLKLSRPALLGLASALEAGRLFAPYSTTNVESLVPSGLRQDVVTELNHLHRQGLPSQHIAYTLNLLATERQASQKISDRVDLVWTGQEVLGAESRDTRVVVQELFSTAKSQVLISSFAIDKGEKARTLFQTLATRMDDNPSLQVRMFLNVQRPHQNQEPESVLLRRFADTFRKEIWTGNRLPEVFHEPRSLAIGNHAKACLHAKCVVVDEQYVLITSANFTEAAHERNLEAGVLLNDAIVAKAMRTQFETLVSRNILRRVPGLRRFNHD